MQDKYLSKDDVKKLLEKRPQSDRKQIFNKLVEGGYTIEGFNDNSVSQTPTRPQPKPVSELMKQQGGGMQSGIASQLAQVLPKASPKLDQNIETYKQSPEYKQKVLTTKTAEKLKQMKGPVQEFGAARKNFENQVGEGVKKVGSGALDLLSFVSATGQAGLNTVTKPIRQGLGGLLGIEGAGEDVPIGAVNLEKGIYETNLGEASKLGVQGTMKIAQGGLQTGFAPVTSATQTAVEALPSGGIRENAEKLVNLPSWAIEEGARAIGKTVNPNLSDEEIQENFVEPLTTALGIGLSVWGAKAGSQANASTKLVKKANKLEKLIEKDVGYGVKKGIKPTVVGKKNAGDLTDYYQKSTEAIKSISANKKDLQFMNDKGKLIKGKDPSNLSEFSDAITQRKQQVFEKYDALAKEGTAQGLKVKMDNVASELRKFADDPVTKEHFADIADYAAKKADLFKKEMTPSQVQDLIKEYNSRAKDYTLGKSKNAVDNMIAETLRENLAKTIDGLKGDKYSKLKKEYGTLKTIEKDVSKRVLVDARKAPKGLIDQIASFGGLGQALIGAATGNLPLVVAGGAPKGLAYLLKRANDPNLIVKNMFKKVSKTQNKINRLNSKFPTASLTKQLLLPSLLNSRN